MKHAAQVFNRVDGFASVFDRHVGRVGNVFDKQA
jgi:hypothetical protein